MISSLFHRDQLQPWDGPNHRDNRAKNHQFAACIGSGGKYTSRPQSTLNGSISPCILRTGKYPSVLKWTIYGPLRVLADGPLCIAHAEMLLSTPVPVPHNTRRSKNIWFFRDWRGSMCGLVQENGGQPGTVAQWVSCYDKGDGPFFPKSQSFDIRAKFTTSPRPCTDFIFSKIDQGRAVRLDPPSPVCHSSSGERKHFPPKRIF